MRVLHTADWHLGQKLVSHSREEEHEAFLNWLIEEINKQNIEVFVIAGDIFDNGNPPHYAQSQYYRFLTHLQNTCCRYAIIVGGNHDSVNNLHTSKPILEFLKIYVVGGASPNPQDDIFELYNQKGDISLVVCAVPFLRDKDLQYSIAGETPSEREQKIKDSIKNYYAQMHQSILHYKQKGIPVLATGHLLAAGVTVSDAQKEKDDSERDIYIGNLGKVSAECFSTDFDYIALGHIHKPQKIGGRWNIRYSGSPIPLSFSERKNKPIVLLLDFSKGDLQEHQVVEIEVPIYRKLIRLTGSLEEIQEKLHKEPHHTHTAWAEIVVETDYKEPEAPEKARKIIEEANKNIEALIIRNQAAATKKIEQLLPQNFSLSEVGSEKEVFKKLCESKNPDMSDEYFLILEEAFDELVYKIRN